MGAIRREMNNPKWTAFAIGYQLLYGYLLALIIYQLGSLFTGSGFSLGTIAGFAALAFFIYMLVRKPAEPHSPSSTGKLEATT
jgi:ferrous iron transport protein B